MKPISYVKAILLLFLLFWGICLSAKQPKAPKTQVTFIELGSVNCIPCKMMQPVMKDVKEIYGDKMEVLFYDIMKPQYKAMSTKYQVRVIPTQVFLDKEGKEFFRHEGFYPKDEIVKLIDKHLGIKNSLEGKK